MDFGITIPNRAPIIYPEQVPARSLLEMARKAEEYGFTSVWVGDSALAKPRLESVSLLSAISSITTRVKLGTACMASFPLRNALLLAQQWATLDQLSEGRTILVPCKGGKGGSGDYMIEERVFNLPGKERLEVFEESVEVMKELWTKDKVTFRGKYYSFEDVTVLPKPLQRPHPPIWIVSNVLPTAPSHTREKAFRRVAKLGDGWMVTWVSPSEFHENLMSIRSFLKDYGKATNDFAAAIYYNFNINSSKERAFLESKSYLDTYYMRDWPKEFVEKSVAHGTASECIRRIEEFAKAGATTMMLRPTSKDPLGQLKKIAQDVLPSF